MSRHPRAGDRRELFAGCCGSVNDYLTYCQASDRNLFALHTDGTAYDRRAANAAMYRTGSLDGAIELIA
jgi:hypothetical protein